jgi:TonB family protein
VVWVFMVCGPLVWASSDPSELVSGLKGKIVFLRGMETGDNLNFDAQGRPVGVEEPTSFARSAVKIRNIHVSDKEVVLDCNRLALIFVSTSQSQPLSAGDLHKDFHFIQLDPASITIAVDGSHPEEVDAAIEKVFASSLQDDFSGRSGDEVKAALESLGLNSNSGTMPDLGMPTELHAAKTVASGIPVGPSVLAGGVVAPKLIYSVAPDYSGLGSRAKQSKEPGLCILQLSIDANGVPKNILVLRSAGPDLDANAIEAAKRYRFLPAMHEGKPVAVSINIEMNFRVH